MKLIATYKNGNYQVMLYEDGTKIKITNDDYFDADFPDSIDIKITNYCDILCPMCHEKSVLDGKHAIIDYSLLDTLQSGTELAIGGGNPLSHPNLIELLQYLKNRKIIANITLNETHLLKNINYVQKLIDNKLINGLGISLNEKNEKTFQFQKKNDNVVFHLIIGIISLSDLRLLYDKKIKILLLGYKQIGRGKDYYSLKIENNIKELNDNFIEFRNRFKVLCFDNLALKQLDVKDKISNEEWEKIYMGEDGESTMYIDLVKNEFAVSSISSIRYPLDNSIMDMFKVVKESNINKK